MTALLSRSSSSRCRSTTSPKCRVRNPGTVRCMSMYSSIAASTASHHLCEVAVGDPGREPLHVRLDVAHGQRLHDRPLVREELVDRADRDPGALGQQGGGQAVVPDLVHQLGARVQHPVHPGQAAPLHRHPPQRPDRRRAACVTTDSTPYRHASTAIVS